MSINPSLASKAALLAEQRRILADIQSREKAQRVVVDDIERDLFDAIEDLGLRSIRVEGLGTFSLYDLAWARVVDREKALAWADNTMPEIITLNHQQLSVVVRDALKGDGQLPEGVEFTTSRKISWRKE